MVEKVIGDVIGKLECLHSSNDEVQKEINIALFHLNRSRTLTQRGVQSGSRCCCAEIFTAGVVNPDCPRHGTMQSPKLKYITQNGIYSDNPNDDDGDK